MEEELIPDVRQYQRDLERSLNTLFLRFARPVVELLIFAPVGSAPREDIRDRLGADVEIIDNYYSGEEPAFKSLSRYAHRGPGLLLDKNLRSDIFGEGAEMVKVLLKFHPITRVGMKALESMAPVVGKMIDEIGDRLIDDQNKVMQEVESDLQALEHYLLYGIFDAAGFSAFGLQELTALQDAFLKNKDRWGGVALNEWEKGNAALLQELPAELQQQEFDTMVSDKLKQLGIALQQNIVPPPIIRAIAKDKLVVDTVMVSVKIAINIAGSANDEMVISRDEPMPPKAVLMSKNLPAPEKSGQRRKNPPSR